MRTFSKIALALVLSLGFVSPAFAGKFSSGPAKRAAVQKYRNARGQFGAFKMRSITQSASRKSTHVAVASQGKVNLLTINNNSGRVSAGKTGLVKQSTARGTAHQLARRERGAKGAFSGVYKSGLSNSGKSYVFTSKTDRNEKVYVNVKSGKARKMDGPYKAGTALTSFSAGL